VFHLEATSKVILYITYYYVSIFILIYLNIINSNQSLYRYDALKCVSLYERVNKVKSGHPLLYTKPLRKLSNFFVALIISTWARGDYRLCESCDFL